jgi:hypothetical protein
MSSWKTAGFSTRTLPTEFVISYLKENMMHHILYKDMVVNAAQEINQCLF